MVKARDFDSRIVGSNPATPAKKIYTVYDPLAQSVEHLTFNQGVRSSNLRWITTEEPTKILFVGSLFTETRAVMAKLADAQDLGSCVFDVRVQVPLTAPFDKKRTF